MAEPENHAILKFQDLLIKKTLLYNMIDFSEVEPETIENETFLIISHRCLKVSLERLYWSDSFQIKTKPTSDRMDCSKKFVFKKKFFFRYKFLLSKNEHKLSNFTVS